MQRERKVFNGYIINKQGSKIVDKLFNGSIESYAAVILISFFREMITAKISNIRMRNLYLHLRVIMSNDMNVFVLSGHFQEILNSSTDLQSDLDGLIEFLKKEAVEALTQDMDYTFSYANNALLLLGYDYSALDRQKISDENFKRFEIVCEIAHRKKVSWKRKRVCRKMSIVARNLNTNYCFFPEKKKVLT